MNITFLTAFIPNWTRPSWLYVQPWMVLSLLAISIAGVLIAWSRWHWRMKLSRDLVTYQVAFSHQSEDLPLRSEQLGNMIHNMRISRRVRLFTGQPHITFTYASDGERSLYVTVPRIWAFPEKARDAIIDKLRGSSQTEVSFEIPIAETMRKYGRVKPLRKCPGYSLRTLKGFEHDDPLEVIFNTLDIGDSGRSYITLMVKPVGSHWKRGGRKVREQIRTADDGNIDRFGKRSVLIRIIGAIFRIVSAILECFIEFFNPDAASSGSPMFSSATNPNAGERDRRREVSEVFGGDMVIGEYFEVLTMPPPGAMGVVYICRDVRSSGVYALKTFQERPGSCKALEERFRREALTWIHLGHHPNIVQAITIERFEDRLFIIMEFIAPNDEGKNTLTHYMSDYIGITAPAPSWRSRRPKG